MRKFWLMKSEPDVYSIWDLKKDKSTGWTGVRNYQARNSMRDSITVGDGVLFYHSNTDPKAIVGLAKVSSSPLADPTQFLKKSEYYDPKSKRSQPTWVMVEIAFEKEFAHPLTLEELKRTEGLEKMMLLQKGSRLSVQPVTEAEWGIIVKLGR